MSVNINCEKISNLTKQLIGSSLMADLITHFNNPENQKKDLKNGERNVN